jgi:TfoX/Sxy family transcriptional regulator of competence genes
MAVNEKLAARIRESLQEIKKLEEKKMFRGMCFMVNSKMCVCVSDNEIMCRVDPLVYEELLEKNGTRPMIHNGKTMKGFVYVSQTVLKSKKDLLYWIDLCLDFNKKAKASKK